MKVQEIDINLIKPYKNNPREIPQESIQKVLGDDALNLDGMAEKKNRALGESQLPQGLGDFFFDEDSPIHPDRYCQWIYSI